MAEKFQVVNDPRSQVSAADLKAQYQATETAIHELSQLDVALNRLDVMRSQVNALQAAVKGTADEQPVKAAADQLGRQIDRVEGKITSNPQAQESTLRRPLAVREYALGLQRRLEDSDQAPTRAALDELELVGGAYQEALKAFNDLLTTDVAGFNSAMSARKLPGLVSGQALQP